MSLSTSPAPIPAPPGLLSADAAEVVRATLPAVREHGVQITSVFYDAMLAAHPELRSVFNQANQETGEQRQALAASVVAFAGWLVGNDDAPFQPVVERIAHKHASLAVRPEQYLIVGRYLLHAVGEVLGDAVTPAVAAAWDEVYWLAALTLVAEEARLLQTAGVDLDRPYRPYRVSRRVDETGDVVSLHLVPEDGSEVPDFLPGQYVTVVVDLPDGRRQPRQYSLSNAPGQGFLRLTLRAVRSEGGAPDGAVSTYLQAQVAEGDVLQVSQPFGDVWLEDGPDPVVLVTAGLGITPAAAMLQQIAGTRPHRQVVHVHADHSPATHALRTDLARSSTDLEAFTSLVWYEEPDEAVAPGARTGHVDPDAIPIPAGARAFLCGPLPFMREARAGLLRQGLPADRIRYEVFGPDLWASTMNRA